MMVFAPTFMKGLHIGHEDNKWSSFSSYMTLFKLEIANLVSSQDQVKNDTVDSPAGDTCSRPRHHYAGKKKTSLVSATIVRTRKTSEQCSRMDSENVQE